AALSTAARFARNSSADHAVGEARIRPVAARARAEPANPVARDQHVETIAPRQRHDTDDRGERPWKAQAVRDADRAFGLEPGDAVLDQDHGLVVLRIEA